MFCCMRILPDDAIHLFPAKAFGNWRGEQAAAIFDGVCSCGLYKKTEYTETELYFSRKLSGSLHSNLSEVSF